jgi:DNA-binding transcriptional ArsR family regulator
MQPISAPLHTSLHELSYPVRLEIIAALVNGPMTVNQLCEKLGYRQPNISNHLAALRTAGIVSVRRDGVRRHYRLTPAAVMNVATRLVDLLSVGGDSE